MIYLFLNFFLALAWMMLNGSYSSLNFVVGFTVGFFCFKVESTIWIENELFSTFCICIEVIGVLRL